MQRFDKLAKARGLTCFKVWERTLQWRITSRGNQGQGSIVQHVDLGNISRLPSARVLGSWLKSILTQ